MHWEDRGILLKKQKFGETSHILVFLTPTMGKHAGLYRKKPSKLPESGSCAYLIWRARLQDHLGEWSSLESMGPSPLLHILNDPGKLYALSSALALTDKSLAERDPHPTLYEKLSFFLEALKKEDTSWILNYLSYELSLLQETGFGLDLSRCAVTGSTENLAFVSPKTGHAVTKKGGEGYLHLLFPLPSFLKDLIFQDAPRLFPNKLSLQDAFSLTEHFLEKSLAACSSSKVSSKTLLPPYRALLVAWTKTLKEDASA